MRAPFSKYHANKDLARGLLGAPEHMACHLRKSLIPKDLAGVRPYVLENEVFTQD